jgi:hypothetical protein
MAERAPDRRLLFNPRRSVMKISRTIPLFTITALAAALASSAAAAGSAGNASLVIRHQLHGCHAWSVNGDAYKPSQTLVLARGASLHVTNNDVMPHKLIETSGPAVRFTHLGTTTGTGMAMGLKGTFPPAMLASIGARSEIAFSKPGVYHFTTKPGEDYMAGIKTIGEDNVLRLTVRVR